jgi:metallo-beta-lactamase class B
VYADSVTPVSADGYRYTGAPAAAFRRSLGVIAALPCDILLTPHPSASKLEERAARARTGGVDAFVDPGACKAYAENGGKGLDRRMAEEAAARK